MALFDRSFDRELHAVLHGKAAHENSDNPSSVDALRFTLRRNIHRLEKGLLMRPRRSVFAEHYIEETTGVFAEVVRARTNDRGQAALADDGLLKWAHDVLEEYFAVIGESKAAERSQQTLKEAQRLLVAAAESADDIVTTVPPERIPYRRSTTPLGITIDDLTALARRRRSVRWFKKQPVPRELIDRALDVALQSPSACNRQPFHFHIFDAPELVEQVTLLPIGTRGYAHNVPVMAVLVGRQRAYFSPRDRHLIYIDGALAAMAFMYALEVQGLSSCPINWPDIEHKEKDMSEFLGLAPDERPIMCIAIGYADPEGLVAFSEKKSLGEVREYNFELWGEPDGLHDEQRDDYL